MLPAFLIVLLLGATAHGTQQGTQTTSPSTTRLATTSTPADDDELTERQTLSKDATVLCRASPRGKNDPNVRGYAYSNNRCVALCRNGFAIPWRQTFTASTSCGTGMVCVNRECIQGATSKDLQVCSTIFNHSRRKAKQAEGHLRIEAGILSGCRLRCYNPNTRESLRVNREDGEKCNNRLYDGTCRSGSCRSEAGGIAAIGSVIPIPYQESHRIGDSTIYQEYNVEVEEPAEEIEDWGQVQDAGNFETDVGDLQLEPLENATRVD